MGNTTRTYNELSLHERKQAYEIVQFAERFRGLMEAATGSQFKTRDIEYWGVPILFATATFYVVINSKEWGCQIRIDPRSLDDTGYLYTTFHQAFRGYGDMIFESREAGG